MRRLFSFVHKRCSANVKFCEPGNVVVQKASLAQTTPIDSEDEEEDYEFQDGAGSPIYEYPSLATRSLPELNKVNNPPCYEYADNTLIPNQIDRNISQSSNSLGENDAVVTSKRQQAKRFLKGVFKKPHGATSSTSNAQAEESKTHRDDVVEKKGLKTLRAKYEFVKENENEVSITKDDVVTFVCENDGWTMVRTDHGEGFVPTAYVEDVE